MRLNHPETIHRPPKSVEKLSSTKLVPGAKKVGDRWLIQQTFTFSWFWRLEVQDQGATGLVSGEASLLGLHIAAFLLCPHMAFPLCTCRKRFLVSLPLIRTPVLPD